MRIREAWETRRPTVRAAGLLRCPMRRTAASSNRNGAVSNTALEVPAGSGARSSRRKCRSDRADGRAGRGIGAFLRRPSIVLAALDCAHQDAFTIDADISDIPSKKLGGFLARLAVRRRRDSRKDGQISVYRVKPQLIVGHGVPKGSGNTQRPLVLKWQCAQELSQKTNKPGR